MKQLLVALKRRHNGLLGPPPSIPLSMEMLGSLITSLSEDFMTCDRVVSCINGQSFGQNCSFAKLDPNAGLLHYVMALAHTVLKLCNTPEQRRLQYSFATFMESLGYGALLSSKGVKRHRLVLACIKSYHAQVQLALLLLYHPELDEDPTSDVLAIKTELRTVAEIAADDAAAGGDEDERVALAAQHNREILQAAIRATHLRSSRLDDVALGDLSLDKIRRAQAVLDDPLEQARAPKSAAYGRALAIVLRYTRVAMERANQSTAEEYYCWISHAMSTVLVQEKGMRNASHHVNTALNKVLGAV